MKSIFRSKQKKQHKLFNKKNILGFFIAFIMITSVLGVWQGSTTPTVSYNDYTFKQVTDSNYPGYYLYSTKIDGENALFYNPPQYVDYFDVDSVAIQRIKETSHITITFDAQDPNVGEIELLRREFELGSLPLTDIAVGFATINESGYPIPVRSCDDATPSVPIVYVQSSNESLIELVDNCVIAKGSIMELRDRLLYELYEVI